MTDVETLRANLICIKGPSNLAIINAGRVLNAMQEHQLEATSINNDHDVLRITWIGEFNTHKSVCMKFLGEGIVLCQVYEANTPTKMIGVSEFSSEFFTLRLPLAETLEFIRHHIWANHEK